jgi:aryl-alcohol dehydrogenase-like predicted oxidoreductase
MAEGVRGLSAETIARAADASLERLGIETIDLYYAHQDDQDTPLEETLGAFAALIAAGKVRHVAASNYSAERLTQALEIGREAGMASYVALQPHYNLMERDYETELAGVCAEHGLACLPYFSLARGFLTGKYRPDGPEIQSPRAGGVRDLYMNDKGFAVLDALDGIAAAHEAPVASVALAWLLAKPTVLAPIASATTLDQLQELIASTRLQLSVEELGLLDGAGA